MLYRLAPSVGLLLALTSASAFGALAPAKSNANLAKADFNRDIRPILSEHCYACHGPDEKKRKAGLRLDVQEDAFKELKSGSRALVAGDLSKSALVERIASTDPDEVMPPAKHNKPLKAEQIVLLKRWVQEGAQWKKHWSFIPPERPELPTVKDRKWPRNAIDYFTLARLEKENLKPNPEADKATLIRRATLDLTGLPPTIEEVDAFLADKSRDAYEKLVDRLLTSPHYGERMAQNWMDLARFADTSGYHFDGVRFMWL
jgi:cytochrome c553